MEQFVRNNCSTDNLYGTITGYTRSYTIAQCCWRWPIGGTVFVKKIFNINKLQIKTPLCPYSGSASPKAGQRWRATRVILVITQLCKHQYPNHTHFVHNDHDISFNSEFSFLLHHIKHSPLVMLH